MCVDHSSERWLPVVGQELIVEVSSNGNLRRLDGTPIVSPPASRQSGYSQVCIGGKQSYVHVLVATAFLGPKPPGMDTDHINGDGSDNQADNLRYVTRSENTRNSRRIGGGPNKRVVPPSHWPLIVQRSQLGERQVDIASDYGVRTCTISKIIKKHRNGQAPVLRNADNWFSLHGKRRRKPDVPKLLGPLVQRVFLFS